MFTSTRDAAELEAALGAALEERKLKLDRFTTEVRPLPGQVHVIDIDAKAVG